MHVRRQMPRHAKLLRPKFQVLPKCRPDFLLKKTMPPVPHKPARQSSSLQDGNVFQLPAGNSFQKQGRAGKRRTKCCCQSPWSSSAHGLHQVVRTQAAPLEHADEFCNRVRLLSGFFQDELPGLLRKFNVHRRDESETVAILFRDCNLSAFANFHTSKYEFIFYIVKFVFEPRHANAMKMSGRISDTTGTRRDSVKFMPRGHGFRISGSILKM